MVCDKKRSCLEVIQGHTFWQTYDEDEDEYVYLYSAS